MQFNNLNKYLEKLIQALKSKLVKNMAKKRPKQNRRSTCTRWLGFK